MPAPATGPCGRIAGRRRVTHALQLLDDALLPPLVNKLRQRIYTVIRGVASSVPSAIVPITLLTAHTIVTLYASTPRLGAEVPAPILVLRVNLLVVGPPPAARGDYV